MPARIVELYGVGQLKLLKRRGQKSIRLAVTAKGDIRVSLPSWTPYSAGLAFARKNRSWIAQQMTDSSKTMLRSGQRIGKAHRLQFLEVSALRSVSAKVSSNVVEVRTSLEFAHPLAQQKARAAAERALRREAENLLGHRLEKLAGRHGFGFKQVKVKKLTSRWGSCASDGTICLSYYLMQLPWSLIDYVLLHELTHTQHPNHSRHFWDRLAQARPDAKNQRQEIKKYRPVLVVE